MRCKCWQNALIAFSAVVRLDVAFIHSDSVCGVVMAVGAIHWAVTVVHAFIMQILHEQSGHISETFQR